MEGCVYLYFGADLLTNGSFEDLARLGIEPKEGMSLNFYDLDADDQNRPTYLCASGVLYLSGGRWHAKLNESSIHSVPRDVD